MAAHRGACLLYVVLLLVLFAFEVTIGGSSGEDSQRHYTHLPSALPSRHPSERDGHTIASVGVCIDAIRGLSPSLIALAAASSSDVSVSASEADPTGFAVDVGNYDLCEKQEGALTHCLAGSVSASDRFLILAPHAGICVPVACGPDELISLDLLTFLDDTMASYIGTSNSKDASASVLLTQAGQQKFSYLVKMKNSIMLTKSSKTLFSCGAHNAYMTSDRYMFFSAFALLLFTVLGSTAYTMSSNGLGLQISTLLGDGKVGRGEERVWAQNSFHQQQQQQEQEQKQRHSLFKQVVEAFSLIKTVPFVFTSQNDDQFGILDGFRAISILWVCLGHTLTVSTSIGMLNPHVVLPPSGMLMTTPAQIFLSSRFAVDTFFFISGFLVVLSLLKRLSPIEKGALSSETAIDEDVVEPPHQGLGSSNNSRVRMPLSYGNKDFELSPAPSNQEKLWSWLPLFYIHRVTRIMPPYIFCLLLWWKISVLLGSGPFWNRWLAFTHRCDMYWWTNVFFVNNLIPYDASESEECFYVSWYLANDMQFYLVSPLFVLSFLYNHKFGIIFASGVCILSCIACYYQTMKEGWSAHSFDGLNVTKYSHLFYTKPQYRIPPYCVGMLSAMLWHLKAKYRPSFVLPVWIANSILCIACATIFSLVFGASSAYQNRPCSYSEPTNESCGSNWSVTSLALYNSLTKPLWAVSLSAITLLSGNGQGGAIQAFLSHPVWGPPARLSFSVYLLHVIIINIWMLSRTQKLRYSHFDFAMDYCAVVFVSFACGLVIAVTIESPAAKLSKSLEKWIQQRNEKSQASLQQIELTQQTPLKTLNIKVQSERTRLLPKIIRPAVDISVKT